MDTGKREILVVRHPDGSRVEFMRDALDWGRLVEHETETLRDRFIPADEDLGSTWKYRGPYEEEEEEYSQRWAWDRLVFWSSET